VNKLRPVVISSARRNCMDTPLRINLLLVLGAVLCLATLASAQTVQRQAEHPSPLSLPVAPPPVNLEQSPPSAPTVIYEKGLLTISAYNSTLSDILRRISDQTGADVEIPPQAEERVVTHLGPGPAQDVVRSLLEGSKFNYVIVGLAGDPTTLARVLLSLRPSNSDKLATENASRSLAQTRGAGPSNENDIITESLQQQDNPQEPALPVRAQQQMLLQRQQMVMEAFKQNKQPR